MGEFFLVVAVLEKFGELGMRIVKSRLYDAMVLWLAD